MEATLREVQIYITPSGKRSFRNWLDSFKDIGNISDLLFSI